MSGAPNAPAGARVDEQQERIELRQDLIASSYLQGSFVLGSVGETDFYFDKYLFATKPSILRRLTPFLAGIVDRRSDRLAGTELGSVPLATALSLELGIPFVIVRRQPRGDRVCEGELSPGDRVVLIEDIVASGQHALRSVEQLRAQGAIVQQVVAVVDRGEGAVERLEAAGCQLTSLFSHTVVGWR